MSRLVLAVDVETTGLEPKKDRIVELGWCLFDVDAHEFVTSGGAFISGPVITPEIERITGIRQGWLEKFGCDIETALLVLPEMAKEACAIVAHNANFDRSFLLAERARLSAEDYTFLDQDWIDTLQDLPFEREPDSKKLRYLALDHGLTPSLAHRAQFDAILAAQLLGCYEFDEVLARAKSPAVILRADVSYDDREKAKALGFRWQQIDGVERVFTKLWVKRVKTLDLPALRESARAAAVRLVEVPAA